MFHQQNVGCTCRFMFFTSVKLFGKMRLAKLLFLQDDNMLCTYLLSLYSIVTSAGQLKSYMSIFLIILWQHVDILGVLVQRGYKLNPVYFYHLQMDGGSLQHVAC